MNNAKNKFAGEATIVDVRTPAEFATGHVSGSINIPLQLIPEHLSELRSMDNLVLCCASGNRSSQAVAYLQKLGIECKNAGSWLNINN